MATRLASFDRLRLTMDSRLFPMCATVPYGRWHDWGIEWIWL